MTLPISSFIDCRTPAEEELWLKNHFDRRTLALMLAYFCQNGLQYMNSLVRNIAKSITQDLKEHADASSYTKNEYADASLFSMGSYNIPFAYHLAHRLIPNLFISQDNDDDLSLYLCTSIIMSFLKDLCCIIDFDDKRKKEYDIFVSKIMSLFLPLDNWKPQYHTENAIQLANTIYNEEKWDLLTILADALMDAGCEDEYTLQLLQVHHGSCGRGMWIVDRLIGKR